jgi:hypothetical protein
VMPLRMRCWTCGGRELGLREVIFFVPINEPEVQVAWDCFTAAQTALRLYVMGVSAKKAVAASTSYDRRRLVS